MCAGDLADAMHRMQLAPEQQQHAAEALAKKAYIGSQHFAEDFDDEATIRGSFFVSFLRLLAE